MEPIKFSDIKEKLQAALQEKLNQNPIQGEKGFALIEGFMTLTIQGELSTNLIVGGPIIPVVGLVGNTTGRIYTFALKSILPDLPI